MRRSQAPSVRKAVKRGLPVCEVETTRVTYATTEMQWGTSGGYKSLGPRKYGDVENPLKDKRIFLVLWRPQTNKKHKTWKGNGTVELTATRATLKDETSKVLDVLTFFKPEKFQENALIEFGMKDVEIQVELKTVEECIAQRKEEIENWCRQQNESSGILDTQSEENIIRPQRHLIFKRPKQSPDSKALLVNNFGTTQGKDDDKEVKRVQQPKQSPELQHQPVSPTQDENNALREVMLHRSELLPQSLHESTQRINLKEFICMLAPADLQQLTLQLLADYCRGLEQQPMCPSRDIVEIAQEICDHPVLLKHVEEQPIVSEILLPHLPPWQEMGLYDSAKFEFVHLMLDNLVVARGDKCAIVATNEMCLDIIKGYCQCWEVPYIQIEDSIQAGYFNTPREKDNNAPMVALIVANKLPQIRLKGCKNVILYNFSARSAVTRLLAEDTQIFTLVTAGCLEERLFQEHVGLVEGSDSLMDLLAEPIDPTHKILVNGPSALSKWSQWEPPFSEEFLKETFSSEELPSLGYVFSKQSETIV